MSFVVLSTYSFCGGCVGDRFCVGVVACNGVRRNVALIRLRWAWVEVFRSLAKQARAIPTDSNHCCLNSRASVNRISLGRRNHRRSRFASVVVSVYSWVMEASSRACSRSDAGDAGFFNSPFLCSRIFHKISHSFLINVATHLLPVLRRFSQV